MKLSKELKEAMEDTNEQYKDGLITYEEGDKQIRLAKKRDQKKESCYS